MKIKYSPYFWPVITVADDGDFEADVHADVVSKYAAARLVFEFALEELLTALAAHQKAAS